MPHARPDPTHVALLRGINVGGQHRVPMADLRDAFAAAGAREVRTYIQSGNVIFQAGAATAARIAAAGTTALAQRLGFELPVITRSRVELAAVAAGNPFLLAGADPERLHVVFLATAPTAAAVAGLDPRRSPPDELAVRGREIYLRCPNGMARTKLTSDYFDTRLATTGTARSWRTVLALLELAGG
jgi:uncharacterized protein (DUF1697 family)